MALYWGADYRILDEGVGLLDGLGGEGPRRRQAGRCWKKSAGRLRVRVAASAKPSNILRLLEIAGCAGPLSRGLSVIRERCWAKAGSAGLHPATEGGAKPACGAAGPEGGPVSYFELDLPS